MEARVQKAKAVLHEGEPESPQPGDSFCASCALPLVFPPLACEGELYADGALKHALAIDHAYAWGAERVIAIDVRSDLLPLAPDWSHNGLVSVHERAIRILRHEQHQANLLRWRDMGVLYVRVPVGAFESFDFTHTRELLRFGYDSTRRALAHWPPAVHEMPAPDRRGPLRRLLGRLSAGRPS